MEHCSKDIGKELEIDEVEIESILTVVCDFENTISSHSSCTRRNRFQMEVGRFKNRLVWSRMHARK